MDSCSIRRAEKFPGPKGRTALWEARFRARIVLARGRIRPRPMTPAGRVHRFRRMARRIGVLTSGGDAPGMNAAIRGVVRAVSAGSGEVVGIRRGFCGLIDGSLEGLGPRDVANILQRGGSILDTSR